MSLNLHSETHKMIPSPNDYTQAIRIYAADVDGCKPAAPGQVSQSFCV